MVERFILPHCNAITLLHNFDKVYFLNYMLCGENILRDGEASFGGGLGPFPARHSGPVVLGPDEFAFAGVSMGNREFMEPTMLCLGA